MKKIPLILCSLCFILLISGVPELFGQAKVTYSYPIDNAIGASPKTSIGLRYSESLSISHIPSNICNISGSLSGSHSFTITLALDRRTLIFTPDQEFASGEKVKISVAPFITASGRRTMTHSLLFNTSELPLNPQTEIAFTKQSGNFLLGNDSLPPDFPVMKILKNDDPSPGQIYLANDQLFVNQYGGEYLMILDNNGDVIFQRSLAPLFGGDFRPQGNGLYTYNNAFDTKYYALDSNFSLVGTYQAANGYITDSHEFRFLPNGSYLLNALNIQTVNLLDSFPSGDPNSQVQFNIIQEFDAGNNLIFEWRTQDHLHIADATHEDIISSSIDYAHCNSIDFDSDTTLILSFRNMDEITKISLNTGNIIWRLGGKNNQFTFINDSIGFSHQHYVRRIPNGNITMFDNGNFRPGMVPFSRALEYAIDEQKMTVTKVWDYRHSPDLFSSAMGNTQRLENGNTFICWGQCDSMTITEVRPDGSIALEMLLPSGNYTYRALKYRQEELDYLSGVAEPAVDQQQLILGQNFPNPANGLTVIPFSLSVRQPITLILYDALGRTIRTLFNGSVDPGESEVRLDTHDLSAGAYFYKLFTPSQTLIRMMVLSK